MIDGNSTIAISLLIALISVVGVLITIFNTFIKLGSWQGKIEQKLDNFLDTMEKVEEKTNRHELVIASMDNRLTAVETTCKIQHTSRSKKSVTT